MSDAPVYARLSQGASRLATVVLVVAVAYGLATLSWKLWPDPPPVREAPVSTGGGDTPATKTRQEAPAERIAKEHLFGHAASKPQRKEKHKQVIKAPETRLNLTLKGVLAGDDPTQGGAIIADAKKQELYYTVGGSLPGGATLKETYPDYIVLSRNNRPEILRLVRKGIGNEDQGEATRATPNKRRRTSSRGSRGTARGRSLKQLRDSVASNPGSLMEVVRVRELYRGGKLKGFRISPGKDRKLFRQLGFRPGDVVTAVNGVKLDDPLKGLQLLGDLKDLGSLNLDITRRGKPTTLTVNFDQ